MGLTNLCLGLAGPSSGSVWDRVDQALYLWGVNVGISLRFGVLPSMNGVRDGADNERNYSMARGTIEGRGLASVLQ